MEELALPVIQGPTPEQQQLKATVLKQLQADRAIMMIRMPFTAMLAMHLRLVPVVDDRLPTAATDGENIFFNAEFIKDRSDIDRRFILAHEVWHCALAHQLRAFGRDHALWNRACDYEVNHLLHHEYNHHPHDALYDRHFMGLSAEDIYQKLFEENPNAVGDESSETGFDIHDVWKAIKKHGVTLDPDFTPRGRPSSEQQKSEADSWKEKMVGLSQQSQMAGNIPEYLKLMLNKLTQPTVSWKQQLQRFVVRHVPMGERQWLPPSRRHVYKGLYLPSMRGEKLDIAVAIDTSGSCVDEAAVFLSELHGILSAYRQVKLRILVFDTSIKQDFELCEYDLHTLQNLDLIGGGGTKFEPIFTALENNPPPCLIVFTDGFANPVEDPGYPVLWALTRNGVPPTPWGDAINLT